MDLLPTTSCERTKYTHWKEFDTSIGTVYVSDTPLQWEEGYKHSLEVED